MKIYEGRNQHGATLSIWAESAEDAARSFAAAGFANVTKIKATDRKK